MLDHDGGHLAASVVLSHHLYSIFVCRFLLLLVITILFLHILLWWWPRHPQTSNHQDFAFQELKGNIRVFCRYFPSFLSFWRYLTCKFTTQASTIAGGWKGRRGGYQARKYSGLPSSSREFDILLLVLSMSWDHDSVQDEKNLELMKSQQSGAGGANKDLRCVLILTKVWLFVMSIAVCVNDHPNGLKPLLRFPQALLKNSHVTNFCVQVWFWVWSSVWAQDRTSWGLCWALPACSECAGWVS